MSTVTEVKPKVYELLPHLQSSAPIFVKAGKQKTRITKIPLWQTNLVYTFTDEKGKNVTKRLKLNANTIDQQEQIKDLGIPANEKFSNEERAATKFRNGVILVTNKVVQDFMESIPHFEGFKGKSTIRPAYRLVDTAKEEEEENTIFHLTRKAANKIAELDLVQGQDLLRAIHGTHYKVPETIKAVQNALVKHMDSSEEAVMEILKENFSFDEEVTIIINKLMNADLLSFTAIDGAVAKNKNGSWVSLKEVGKQFSFEEKKERFTEFLSTKDGFTLLADLKKMAEDISGAKEVKKKEPKKTE